MKFIKYVGNYCKYGIAVAAYKIDSETVLLQAELFTGKIQGDSKNYGDYIVISQDSETDRQIIKSVVISFKTFCNHFSNSGEQQLINCLELIEQEGK